MQRGRLRADSILATCRGRRCRLLTKSDKSRISYRVNLRLLSLLLRGRCKERYVVVVSRCSAPVRRKRAYGFCPRVMGFVHGFFSKKLGSGPRLTFNFLAKVLHMTGRDVFDNVGGLGACSVLSSNCDSCFNFARGRMGSVLQCCKGSSGCGRLDR